MTFVLPDPHDENWGGCYIAYCAARTTTLRKIDMLHTRLNQVEDIVVEGEKQGKSAEDLAFRKEIQDRLTCLAIILTSERQYLIALRRYLDLCRAVHGRVDRRVYDLMEQLTRVGVPRHIARKVVRDGVAIVSG